jgi:PAS domain S-box-containing protein
MSHSQQEEDLAHSAGSQDAASLQQARQQAEEELIRAKEALERRTAELARSLATISATLEATTDGILVTDDQGRVMSFNQRYVEIWPLPREVIDLLEHWQLLEASSHCFADPQQFLARVRKIYDTAPPETFDLLELADGRVLERFSRIQFMADGNAGRVWSFRDITLRRRAEEAQFRLAAIVTSSDDAIVSKTLEGIVTTWNRGAERMYGYTADEIVGQSITKVIPPELFAEEQMILDRLRKGERIEHYETIRLRKDGARIDVSLTVSPVMDLQGRITGASKIARDITQRKRMEEALRDETRVLELLNATGMSIASTLELRELLQTAIDATTQISGAEFGVVFYNTSGKSGDPFTLQAVSGKPPQGIGQSCEPLAAPLVRLFEERITVRSDDLSADDRYGHLASHFEAQAETPPVRSYLAVPIISRSGRPIGGLLLGHPQRRVFSERTERIVVGIAAQAAVAIDNARLYEDVKAAAAEREQLLEAERAARSEAERVSLLKDEFLATLSHELRTPLNAILGWSQLLISPGADSDELPEGLEAIARNARAQAQLIEDLLDMSRIISGKVRLDVQLVDPALVVDGAVESVRPSAEAKGIRLRKLLDPRAGPVSGDPNRLQQVIWNLLTNAIKFTPKGGRIDVQLQRVNSHLEIVVRDSGMGIPVDFLPHVFERFRQADASTTRTHGGLGIGLSIVKHLIELHGGTVSATSAGEGTGSTFMINLPLAPIRVESGREHPTSPRFSAMVYDQFDLTGVKVLVVDDEADARQLIKRILVQCQAEVLVASSAAQAIELLEQQRPHVLVSDIGMPERDGYDLIRQVRKLASSQGGHTPAVALTAFARSEDRTRAMVAGYNMHIAKPVEPHELLATVARLADHVTER